MGTPSFCAFWRSMSTNSCGVLAENGENTEGVEARRDLRARRRVHRWPRRAAAAPCPDDPGYAWRSHRRCRCPARPGGGMHDDERAFDRRESLAQLGRDGSRAQALLHPRSSGFVEHREHAAAALPACVKVAPRQPASAGMRATFRAYPATMRFDLLARRSWCAPAMPRPGNCTDHDDIAAILCRNEALRCGVEQPAGAADQRRYKIKIISAECLNDESLARPA
jgi:hypothetical protein